MSDSSFSSHLHGAIVVAAMNPIKEVLPQLQGSLTGTHSDAKHRGRWYQHTVDAQTKELAMPTRDKYLHISSIGLQAWTVAEGFARGLEDLDSQYEDTRFLFKLNKLMAVVHQRVLENSAVVGPYVAVVNNTGMHGSFSLFSHERPLYVYGIYDAVNTSVQLVWTTSETFVRELRATNLTRYLIYRFPDVLDRPLFINTQVICRRWHDWMKSFKGGDANLRAFNVLETALYLDPNKEGYERG